MPRMVGRWDDEVIRPLIAVAFESNQGQTERRIWRETSMSPFPIRSYAES